MHKSNIIVVMDPDIKRNGLLNFELLGKARALAAEDNLLVQAIYAGEDDENYMQEILCHGAHKLSFCNTGPARGYRLISRIVKEAVVLNRPELVIFPGTVLCKAIASTLATELGAGLTADCIDIRTDAKWKYVFSRAAMSSSVIADIVCINTDYRISTIKQNVFSNNVRKYPKSNIAIEIIKMSSGMKNPEPDLLYSEPCQEISNTDLKRAKLIFAVGRGVLHEDIDILTEYTNRFGGVVGGTRVLVEQGILPKNRQIGQSGVTVAPDLYVAFGISGASQHVAGIVNAKKVIAINRDENAPIFRYSDYAIVADTHDIIRYFKKESEG